jgi:C1A family cysteine protease
VNYVEELKVNSYKDVILGVQKDPQDERDYLVSDYLLKINQLSEIPEQVDLESSMTPVKNQGPLGSCVAFAVCSVKEWQEKQEYKLKENSKKDYDLSEQWLYYKCKEIDSWPGIQGTAFRYAMRVLRKEGIPVEQGWNYNPRVQGEPEKWAQSVANWYKCAAYWRITSLDELKSLLVKGPIAIGIICFDEIFTPTDGVVAMPKNKKRPRGGHAIVTCGFSDETKLIKFKNSWGTSWGKNGYGFISYDYFNAYCLDAWYFEDTFIQSVSTTTTTIPQVVSIPVIKKEKVAMEKVKVKLINKLNQLLYVHVVRKGKITALPIVSKGMIGITSAELAQSPDIKDKIARGFLEKK